MAKKKKIKVTAVGLISAAMAVGVAGFIVYAALTQYDYDDAENTFTPANVEIAVEENGDDNSDPEVVNEIIWTPGTDTYTADKEVAIKNLDTEGNNNTDAYIRVCLIPRWKVTVKTADGDATADYSGYTLGDFPDSIIGNEYVLGVVGDDGINRQVTFRLNSKWSNNWIYKDGYFYCKTVVAPGSATPTLLESVTVTTSFYNEFSNAGCDFRVDVIADSIQADGGAVDVRWSAVRINDDSELELNTTNP